MSDLARVVGSKPVCPDGKTKSIMDWAIAGEQSVSRLLMTYIVIGLIFMLLPGTFLGVWNLIKISSREAVNSVSPARIQAHGHAQLFGWASTVVATIWKMLDACKRKENQTTWLDRERKSQRTRYPKPS